MMNWWLDKGVAGFRMDAITYLKKQEGLPSYPADGEDGLVTISPGALNRPGIGEFLTEIRDRTYGRVNAMTVGEASGVKGEELEKYGMVLSGISPDGRIVEMLELSDHPFFVGTQGHPELKSRPNRAHPLFRGLIHAAVEYSQREEK